MTDTDAQVVAEMQIALGQLLSGVVPDAIIANARELADLREAKKEIERRENLVRTPILLYLDFIGKDSVTADGVSISRHTHERKGVDRPRMERLYPKVLADVATSTPVTQVRVEVKD